MDKTSEKVLTFLCFHKDYEKYAFFFNNGTFELSAKLLNMSENDLKECLNYLCENKYIQYVYLQNRPVGLLLKHKGKHFREFNRISTIQFIFKSIIVPVIVSVSTTLVTSIAIHGSEHLLSLIQELLKNN